MNLKTDSLLANICLLVNGTVDRDGEPCRKLPKTLFGLIYTDIKLIIFLPFSIPWLAAMALMNFINYFFLYRRGGLFPKMTQSGYKVIALPMWCSLVSQALIFIISSLWIYENSLFAIDVFSLIIYTNIVQTVLLASIFLFFMFVALMTVLVSFVIISYERMGKKFNINPDITWE